MYDPTARTAPPGQVTQLATETPLELDCGLKLSDIPVAYQTHGRLNASRSNVILVAHALTGDQVIAGPHPLTGAPGWWDRMVGPGRVLDTDRYFVICSNILGGCMGTLGPAHPMPSGDKRWGADFPPVTIADMVRLEARLMDHLGIERLFCAIGGSMGGMQVLEWMRLFPERIASAIPIATTARHSAQQIAINAIARAAIVGDPAFQGGEYYDTGTSPVEGLSRARMLAHLSYRTPEEMDARFGRQPGAAAPFAVEDYLRHHGDKLARRFDANSYLTIIDAMDRFDLGPDDALPEIFARSGARVCLLSYTLDWLYPPAQTAHLAALMAAGGLNVAHHTVETLQGHDSFLLPVEETDRIMLRFLEDTATALGIA